MKTLKILFLGISLVLISCSGGEYFNGDDIITDWIDGEDENEHYEYEIHMFPPEWIFGRYYAETNDYWYYHEFNNFYISRVDIDDPYPHDLNAQLSLIRYNKHVWSLIEQTSTETTYFYSIRENIPNSPVYSNYYQKISNDSLISIYTHEGEDTIIKYGKRH